MRLTARHFYDFGDARQLVGSDLLRPEAWDKLRTATSGPFSLPPERDDWEQAAASHPELPTRAKAIDAALGNAGTVASYGAGTGQLELLLHRHSPERQLVLTDYAPESVARLQTLFPEARVVVHDLMAEPPLDADLHLFHRIDTEFTNRQWKEIFERFADRRVLLVATEVVPSRLLLKRVAARLRRRPGVATRAGWIRNRAAFEGLWRATHHSEAVELVDLQGWFLTPSSR